MTIILMMLLAVFLIAFAILLIPIKINAYLEASTLDVHAKAAWSFIKAELSLIDDEVLFCAFFFEKKIFSRFLNRTGKKPRGSAFRAAKALSLKGTSLDINYGFNEPFATGISWVLLNFITSFFNITEVGLYPDFLPETEFLSIRAKTNLSIGKTIVNLSRQKRVLTQQE